ncbi:MAG: hypothetical protein B6D59_06215 [Campylobacteraceae bacterium 4484_4]|nr:MAG: hypothetical protein B6D59_06215 [Campylobacteraceae bacterium 4484_4]
MIKIFQDVKFNNPYWQIGLFFLIFTMALFLKAPSQILVFLLSIILIVLYFLLKIKYIRLQTELSHQNNLLGGYRDIMEHSGCFAKIDSDFNLLYTNKAFQKSFFSNASDSKENLLNLLNQRLNNRQILNEIEQKLKEENNYKGVLEIKDRDEIRYLSILIYPAARQNRTKYLLLCNDITSVFRSDRELKKEFFVDPLTNLPTRLKLLDDLKEAKKRKSNHAFTLIYIHIDAFEEINEFFGIDTGNKLLEHVALWLSGHLPNRNASLYKFEHNNFAIFTASRISLSELEEYLKSLSSSIMKENFSYLGADIDISLTMGLSRGREQMLKNAYLALQEAKKLKKPYRIFNKKSHNEERFLENIKTNKKIKEALNENRVVPFYQPIMNLETEEIEKFESLMRIRNRDNSYQRPIEFLEIAKTSRLYPDLTRAMIKNSFEEIKTGDQAITINISVEDILDPKVSSFILRQLARHEVGEKVTFEILESDQIQNYRKVANFIKKVKSYGCKVAIDDFGSGYSNFEQLLKLDVDYIKIDGSLIRNLTIDKESEIVTKTIISFSKELGIKTIAEFVSSKEIFDKVKQLGIDYAQGYYIGKPGRLIG